MKRRVNYCLTSHQEPTIQLTIVGTTDYTHEVWFYSFCCSLLNFTLGYSFNKKDIKDKQRMCQQSLHHQGVCVCRRVHTCTRMLNRVRLFCDPVDCSPPGSSVHGILQARILEFFQHSLLQGIFPAQGSNTCLLPFRQVLSLSHLGSASLQCITL